MACVVSDPKIKAGPKIIAYPKIDVHAKKYSCRMLCVRTPGFA
jgi:hypothetical protein